jgi:hypothetical protein
MVKLWGRSHADVSARVVLLLLLLVPVSADAAEISGRYTNLFFHTENLLNQKQTGDLNRLRLRAEERLDHFSWELVYDHSWLYGGVVRDAQYQAASSLPYPTYLDLTAYIYRGQSLDWRHSLYRGWLQYERDQLLLTLGRQRVAWGSGRIWNPTDRFNPVDPTAVEKDQKVGVDAFNTAWRYDGFGSFQVILAPGSSEHNVTRKVAGRWQDTFGEFDVAAMGGLFGSEQVLGIDFAGNIGDGGGRLEVVRSTSGPDGAYTQLMAGYDYTLFHAWFPGGLYLGVEYFYNGASSQHHSLTSQDRLQSLSRSLWGGMLGYDLTALLRFDFLLLADMTRHSFFYAPRVIWSVTDSVDLAAIVQLPTDGQSGEFASQRPLYAMQLDWYF